MGLGGTGGVPLDFPMRSQRSISGPFPGFEDLGLFLTKDVEEGEAFASEIENPSGGRENNGGEVAQCMVEL